MHPGVGEVISEIVLHLCQVWDFQVIRIILVSFDTHGTGNVIWISCFGFMCCACKKM